MLAYVLLALTLPAVASPTPSPPPAIIVAPTSLPVRASAKPLAPVIINGVLFRAVEFDTGSVVWRNLAVTVTTDRLAAWRALSIPVKNSYAEQMIDNYRVGMKYGHDIKLTFVDERSATLDQYLWTPPPERK